jgi:hypothetical protein
MLFKLLQPRLHLKEFPLDHTFPDGLESLFPDGGRLVASFL